MNRELGHKYPNSLRQNKDFNRCGLRALTTHCEKEPIQPMPLSIRRTATGVIKWPSMTMSREIRFRPQDFLPLPECCLSGQPSQLLKCIAVTFAQRLGPWCNAARRLRICFSISQLQVQVQLLPMSTNALFGLPC